MKELRDELMWPQKLGLGVSFYPFFWRLSFHKWGGGPKGMYVIEVGPFTFTLSVPN